VRRECTGFQNILQAANSQGARCGCTQARDPLEVEEPALTLAQELRAGISFE